MVPFASVLLTRRKLNSKLYVFLSAFIFWKTTNMLEISREYIVFAQKLDHHHRLDELNEKHRKFIDKMKTKKNNENRDDLSIKLPNKLSFVSNSWLKTRQHQYIRMWALAVSETNAWWTLPCTFLCNFMQYFEWFAPCAPLSKRQ